MPVDVSTVPVAIAIGTSGITLGGGAGLLNDDGCVWKWSSDDARGEGADTREETGDNVDRHGLWDATRFYGGQMPLIRGSVRYHGPNALAVITNAQKRLRAAVAVAYADYVITMPGFTGRLNARRQGRPQWTVQARNATDTYAYAVFSFTLFCGDSFLKAAYPTTFTIGFPATGGVDWTDPGPDRSDPGADYSTTDPASVVTINNTEDAWVPLSFTLTGPITAVTWVLQQGTTRMQQQLINNDFGATTLLNAGQTVTVDNDFGQVLLNGVGRYPWLVGDLLLAPPGQSVLSMTGSGTGTVTGSYTPARS